MPLPNLVVIGAPRCGTTSLHRYLDAHPEIAVADGPDSDEIHFFSQDVRWEQGLEWYSRLFRNAPVRAEISPSYAEYPASPFVPERMASTLPDVRLMYLVRDPIDRIVSSWHQESVVANESRSIEEALADLDSLYVACSRYATQLERYLPHFPEERILVVDQHDLRHHRAETLRSIFRFLGVDESFTSPDFDAEWNSAMVARPLTPGGRRLMLALHRLLGHRATNAVSRCLPVRLPFVERGAPEPRPVVSPELRARLTEVLVPEVDRLRELTGKQFAAWTI